LYVTALGLVETQINGSRVGDAVLSPGWTAYRERLLVWEYDVSALVQEGTNVLGAILGEGWAVGPLGSRMVRQHYADRPALFAQLELTYDDHQDLVVTAPSSAPKRAQDWQVGSGGVRANGLYAGETFDARLEVPNWATPDFKPTNWGPAIRYDWPVDCLELASVPPVRRIEELRPVKIITGPAGYPIIDFGQNIAGWVRLNLVAPKRGRDIIIRHAQGLTPDRTLEREPNRGAKATDRYIAAGQPQETWEPRFTYHGFRYIEVEGWHANPRPEDFTAIVIHSDMTRHGWFESSNPALDRLHANTVWSMRSNFVSIPTDSPERNERLGWTGDLNLFVPTATYLYDVRAVIESWLTDLMIERARVGNTPRTAPLVDPRPPRLTALWGDALVNVAWTLYQEYGDPEILRRCWAAMVSYVDEVAGLLDGDGLWRSGFQYGDWGDPDSPTRDPLNGRTDKYLIAQAFYTRTTAQVAQIAELLGEPGAEHYRDLNSLVKAGFQARYVSGRGIVEGETPTGYALAICLGLLSGEQQAYAGKRLNSILAGRDYTAAAGFAGTPFLADALTQTGHLAGAYKLFLQTKYASFGYPVTMGATTIWERWDTIRPDGTLNRHGLTSLNHYALGAITDWLHRIVGGLTLVEPGWTQFRIAPQVGGSLTHARTTHQTPHGPAMVSWRLADNEMTLEVNVPEGTTATVHLPLHPEHEPHLVTPGHHQWSYQPLT
jgi:alpha-L-rhamnosidase